MNALAVQNPHHKCDLGNNLRMIQSLTKNNCRQYLSVKIVVFSVGGCYSNQLLVLQASCCIQSGSILYFLEATPTRGYNYWA